MRRKTANNHMHSDIKKRRSFLALLLAAGDVERLAYKRMNKWEPYSRKDIEDLIKESESQMSEKELRFFSSNI